MKKRSVDDDGAPFESTDNPPRVVLFSVGAGGNPERHLPLLQSLADHGCAVVAPHFERLACSSPTLTDLLLRARRLRLALDAAAHPTLPVVGVGHSIGATVLLALAGAAGSTLARERIEVTRDERFSGLVLFAPASDFLPGIGRTRRTARDDHGVGRNARWRAHCLRVQNLVALRPWMSKAEVEALGPVPPPVLN